MSNLLTQLVEEINQGSLHVIDLTQPLSPDTPILPLPSQFQNTPKFRIWELSHYDDRGPAWYWNAFETGEHTGTHFDAPIHWISGKDLPDSSVDRISPRQFIGTACVLDISKECAKNPDHLVHPEDILTWESEFGKIPAGSWLLLRTGWSRKGAVDYINLKDDGPHTPGFAKETSELLARQRNILGVGVETVGTDAGQAAKFDPPFPNHYVMHGRGKFGLAGLTNLHLLPVTGAVVIAAPLKIVNGSGSPVRVIAIVPKQ